MDRRPPPAVSVWSTTVSQRDWERTAARLRLSPRELEIVQRIFGGDATEKQIALNIGMSHKTVHSHMMRLYDKLGVRTRAQMLLRVVGELHAAGSSRSVG